MAWEKKYKVDIARTIMSYYEGLKKEKCQAIEVRDSLSLEMIAGALLGIAERIEEGVRLLEKLVPYVPSGPDNPSSSKSRICSRCEMSKPLRSFKGNSRVCRLCTDDIQKDQS